MNSIYPGLDEVRVILDQTALASMAMEHVSLGFKQASWPPRKDKARTLLRREIQSQAQEANLKLLEACHKLNDLLGSIRAYEEESNDS